MYSKEPMRNPFLNKGFIRPKEIIIFVRIVVCQIWLEIYYGHNSKEDILFWKMKFVRDQLIYKAQTAHK